MLVGAKAVIEYKLCQLVRCWGFLLGCWVFVFCFFFSFWKWNVGFENYCKMLLNKVSNLSHLTSEW